MGVSPKWVKSKRRREKKKERLNDGNNNGQATHGARKPPGAIKMYFKNQLKICKNIRHNLEEF